MRVLPLWMAACSFLGAVVDVPRTVAAQDRERSEPSAKTPVGAETENRFPPLTIPERFTATLFACDPLVEYPSVISIGPRSGTLFVAHDYVTGLGVEIVRRDEVRLIEDTDEDGYADRSLLFAEGFNSIQGLAFHDGTVFVMHAPLLTSLEDTNGDGAADVRIDLIDGLGLPPEENSNRLHCANGVTVGHDGWLYLALGDRGCDVQRPEGDRLLFQQGGILRCRAEGTDLHVFSTGLRNIYDVALDEELNVFVRDNENDGGDYMIRVCHCFFGSDHGYPYHYYERPDEPMPPLADLGRGSSAGGTAYLEMAFPQAYRQSLFFCEWGRAVVRYPQARWKSSFEPMSEIDFAAGAANDPYGFKPTDLVVDYDGSLLVSDWADGQRPKRGRGRIYRIAYQENQPAAATPTEQQNLTGLVEHLESTSYHRRIAAQLDLQRRGVSAAESVSVAVASAHLGPQGRMHGVWIIAQSGAEFAMDSLYSVAASDPDPRVRAQAVRAIGDLTDPVLTENRIDAGRGDSDVAVRIAQLAEDSDPRIMLEALIVLRRLRWPETPTWIARHLTSDDPALNHAATQAMRRCGNWPGVTELLDGPARIRKLALHALAEQRIVFLAEELIRRLEEAEIPTYRREYADALSRIVRQEGPWSYWGFRPAPRPAAAVDWEMTEAIVAALNARLADVDFDVRSFVLQRMQREGAAPELARLGTWLREEFDPIRTTAVLAAIAIHDAPTVRPLLIESLLRKTLADSSRVTALELLVERLPVENESKLAALASQLEDGPVLAALIRELGERPRIDVDDLLVMKLNSYQPRVRAEAIRALGRRGVTKARDRVGNMLTDESHQVRLAAVETAGLLGAREVITSLRSLAAGSDQTLVNASLESLRQLRDAQAITAAAKALKYDEAQLTALRYLSDFGEPELTGAIVETAATNRSFAIQQEAARTLSAWEQRYSEAQSNLQRSLAEIQGRSGQLVAWRVAGPLSSELSESLRQRVINEPGQGRNNDEGIEFVTSIANDVTGVVRLTKPEGSDDADTWLAWSPVLVLQESDVEMLASATGGMSVWLNGNPVHQRHTPGPFRPDSDRFAANLRSGLNLVAAEISSDDQAPRLQLRFRRRSSQAEHERLTQFALNTHGNASRGRDVFENVDNAACIRCHRLGEKGGRVGPDLTGIGRRFSRIHLIESILEPGRTVAPSYATVVVVTNGGRVVTGVVLSEDEELLILGDNQGKTHEIRKAEIDEVVSKSESTMPGGLEKKLTDREFVDLLAFLESQQAVAVE